MSLPAQVAATTGNEEVPSAFKTFEAGSKSDKQQIGMQAAPTVGLEVQLKADTGIPKPKPNLMSIVSGMKFKMEQGGEGLFARREVGHSFEKKHFSLLESSHFNLSCYRWSRETWSPSMGASRWGTPTTI